MVNLFLFIYTISVFSNQSGAPRESRAAYLRKFDNPSIREKLVVTSAYDLTVNIQTLGEGEGSQESAQQGRSML